MHSVRCTSLNQTARSELCREREKPWTWNAIDASHHSDKGGATGLKRREGETKHAGFDSARFKDFNCRKVVILCSGTLLDIFVNTSLIRGHSGTCARLSGQ